MYKPNEGINKSFRNGPRRVVVYFGGWTIDYPPLWPCRNKSAKALVENMARPLCVALQTMPTLWCP